MFNGGQVEQVLKMAKLKLKHSLFRPRKKTTQFEMQIGRLRHPEN